MTATSGWKTYLAAGLLALSGVTENFLGIDIPGVTVADNWLVLVFAAVGLSGLRAALPAK